MRGRGSPAPAERKSQPGSAAESPVRVGVTEERGSAAVEIGGKGCPRVRVEGDQEGLATLGPAEADDGAVEVDILDPQEPDRRVAGRGRHEDRDDRPIAEIERPVSSAAPLQGLEVCERRALRRGLLAREQRIERGPSARPPERVDPEEALVDEPDRERADRSGICTDRIQRQGLRRTLTPGSAQAHRDRRARRRSPWAGSGGTRHTG